MPCLNFCFESPCIKDSWNNKGQPLPTLNSETKTMQCALHPCRAGCLTKLIAKPSWLMFIN